VKRISYLANGSINVQLLVTSHPLRLITRLLKMDVQQGRTWRFLASAQNAFPARPQPTEAPEA